MYADVKIKDYASHSLSVLFTFSSSSMFPLAFTALRYVSAQRFVSYGVMTAGITYSKTS
jgi:hypothetical protein